MTRQIQTLLRDSQITVLRLHIHLFVFIIKVPKNETSQTVTQKIITYNITNTNTIFKIKKELIVSIIYSTLMYLYD